MNAIAEIVGAVSLVAGAFFVVVGAIGLIRMPDCYTRMHASSVTETLGAGLLLFGLLLQAGVTLNGAKLVMLGLLIFFASPTSSHALARAAFMRERPATRLSEEQSPSTR